MRKHCKIAATMGVVCAVAWACSPAWADTTFPSSAPSSQTDFFPRGVWTFETYGQFAAQPGGTREDLYSGTVGLGYYFIPHNSLSLEFIGMHGAEPDQNVTVLGGGLMLRTHLIEEQHWSLLIDFGPDLYESNHRIPPTGTDFNFSFQTGVGGTVHLWDNTNLLTGVRYLHISNARLDGPLRNPSLNAIEGYMGLLIKL
jgi:hypothetical protein